MRCCYVKRGRQGKERIEGKKRKVFTHTQTLILIVSLSMNGDLVPLLASGAALK